MGAPAGFEFTPGGTWSFGSTRGEWSPSVCGCGSGSCLCGGSCWCEGEGTGLCGRGGKSSAEVRLLPDNNGEIWASTTTWNVTLVMDEIRAAVRKAMSPQVSANNLAPIPFWPVNLGREQTTIHHERQSSPWSEVDIVGLDKTAEDVAQNVWSSTRWSMTHPDWCVIHCFIHYFVAMASGVRSSIAVSVAWEFLEYLPRVLPWSEHVIDIVFCDRFGDLLAASNHLPLSCKLLAGFPDRLPKW